MEGFNKWAGHHCTVFGMFEKRHMEMVASWEPLFDAAGWRAEELTAATDWLATHAPPEFPSQHLGAIQGRIRGRRAVDVAAQYDEPDRGTCTLCGGTGRVEAPDPRGVLGDEWRGVKNIVPGKVVFFTYAVVCSCERGRFGNFTDGKGVRMLTLNEYECVNPGWQKQLARRQRETVEEAALAPAVPEFDAILAGLRARQRQPGDDGE